MFWLASDMCQPYYNLHSACNHDTQPYTHHPLNQPTNYTIPFSLVINGREIYHWKRKKLPCNYQKMNSKQCWLNQRQSLKQLIVIRNDKSSGLWPNNKNFQIHWPYIRVKLIFKSVLDGYLTDNIQRLQYPKPMHIASILSIYLITFTYTGVCQRHECETTVNCHNK